MLLDDLRVKKDTIVALGRQYGDRHIRVFESVARYEERPDSDIDFLVEFPRGYDLFSQRLPLAERLGRLLTDTWTWSPSTNSIVIYASKC